MDTQRWLWLIAVALATLTLLTLMRRRQAKLHELLKSHAAEQRLRAEKLTRTRQARQAQVDNSGSVLQARPATDTAVDVEQAAERIAQLVESADDAS